MCPDSPWQQPPNPVLPRSSSDRSPGPPPQRPPQHPPPHQVRADPPTTLCSPPTALASNQPHPPRPRQPTRQTTQNLRACLPGRLAFAQLLSLSPPHSAPRQPLEMGGGPGEAQDDGLLPLCPSAHVTHCPSRQAAPPASPSTPHPPPHPRPLLLSETRLGARQHREVQ